MKIFKSVTVIVAALLMFSCKSGENKEAVVSTTKDSLIEKINSPELKAVNEELLKDPNSAELYNKRAKIYLGIKELEAATGDAQRAIKIDSTKAEFYLTLVDAYFASNKTRQAKELLEIVSKRFPDNTEGLLKLGELFFLVRQYENAIAQINKVLKIDENIARAYYLKGSVFKEMGDTTKAISSMQTAIEQDNKYFDAFVDIGLMYSVRKNPLAFEYFDNALRLKPGNESAMYAKAKLLQDMNKVAEAIAEYEKMLSINKDNTMVLYNMGAIYLDRKKDAEKAIDYFSKAIASDPKYTEAYFARGVCYEVLKDIPNAKADYNMCLQVTPNFEMAIEALNNLDKK